MNNYVYDEDLETLRASVVLGNDCAAFFNTDAGRYVKARATETVLDCIEKIKAVDPGNKIEVARIQLELKSADNALQWLNDGINNGSQAMQQLQILASNEGQ